MNILIVEDEKRLADALAQILREQKYMVDAVYDGADGLAYGESGIYDCIILDVMLPSMNGFDVCLELRKKKITTPVLMLTAKDAIYDKVKGLDAGADDYMTKPFSPDELLARLRVLTRRRGEVILDEMRYEDITLHIDKSTLSCAKGFKTIHLNFKECEMLKLFMSKPEVIISKQDLITRIWGYDSDASDNNVEAYVSFLRKKLAFVESGVEIVSAKKLGYKLTAKG
ncbi:MAG: response regulator transcription factor [Clostridia bacterium]|nr:response regulator transcription factor [Clostridia bacterium]